MKKPANFNEFVSWLEPSSHANPDFVAHYFIEQAGGYPIIEGNTAHFLAKAEEGYITAIAGEMNGWDARQGEMQPIGGGFVHYQQDFEPDARVDYLLAYVPEHLRPRLYHAFDLVAEGVRISRDPLNPLLGMSGLGDRSGLAMPAYQQPEITKPRPNTPTGTLHEEEVQSDALGQGRLYSVYTPVGYEAQAGPYPAIFFQDGGDYLNYGAAPTIIDNMIADGLIPPIVAVFTPPLNRVEEYDVNDAYVRFFADELVAAVSSKYAISADPAQRAVFGPSMGGIISLYIGAQRSDVFGLVGAQSSVVKRDDDTWDARRVYDVTPRLPLKLHMVIGTYEDCFNTDDGGNCRDMLSPVRDLQALLTKHGYPLQYSEHHYGHSWAMWRDDLPNALRFLFAV